MANISIQEQALRSETKDIMLGWLSTKLYQDWKPEILQPEAFAKRFVVKPEPANPNEMIFSPAGTNGQAVQYINLVTYKIWHDLNNRDITARIVFPTSKPMIYSIAIDLNQPGLLGKLKLLEAESFYGHDSSRRHLDMVLKSMRTPPKDSTPQR